MKFTKKEVDAILALMGRQDILGPKIFPPSDFTAGPGKEVLFAAQGLRMSVKTHTTVLIAKDQGEPDYRSYWVVYNGDRWDSSSTQYGKPNNRTLRNLESLLKLCHNIKDIGF